MLKQAVFLTAAFCLVHSQRPWHAGSSNRLPAVLPQYLDEQAAAAAQAAQAAGAPEVQAAGVNASLVNRIGEGNVNTASQTIPTTTVMTTTTVPLDLPVDAHGDVDLVNRIKTWPRDKQPFWYINWQAIQAHRGDVNNTAQQPQTQPNTRSFFAG